MTIVIRLSDIPAALLPKQPQIPDFFAQKGHFTRNVYKQEQITVHLPIEKGGGGEYRRRDLPGPGNQELL